VQECRNKDGMAEAAHGKKLAHALKNCYGHRL
jgi:hypothetical protein